MPWDIYEFLDHRGEGVIAVWLQKERIQKRAIALLNQKLDLLAQVGPELPPQMLASLGDAIFKLKVKGPVQLRPLLCPGPINHDSEYTLLLGCIERGSELFPNDAIARAIENRNIILETPERRCVHDYHF